MTFSPRAISSSVLFAALVSGPASAIEPGVYECRIESAVGLTAVGRKFSLTEAPQTFRLQAVNAPIMPDELRKPPYSLQYYQAEEMPTISASVDARLFLHPATALRSQDGIIYAQGPNVLALSRDGAFIAYGLADRNAMKTIAVYSGSCTQLK